MRNCHESAFCFSAIANECNRIVSAFFRPTEEFTHGNAVSLSSSEEHQESNGKSAPCDVAISAV